ncbi:MAG: amino acid adenylation domain-containing protein, partial [Arenicella sp.]
MLRFHAASRGGEVAYTFIDETGAEHSITFAELHADAKKIAISLREYLNDGERVALLMPTSLDYIKSFYGCLLGGLVAVPLYPPTNSKSIQRLTTIMADSQATVALTTNKLAEELSQNWSGEKTKFFSTETLSGRLNGVDYSTRFKPYSIAFLQYTSGSTGDPKGVIISHENIISNVTSATAATQVKAGETFCSWLPLHHDMGMVVSVLTPLYLGGHSVIMSPTRFIRRPRRWLEAISQYKAVLTASPNFAFDYCVNRVTDESVVGLDLTRWRVAINGAEPLSAKSISDFTNKFSVIGVANTTIYPAYGMAEATVFVSGGDANSEPVTESFNKLELQRGVLLPATTEENSVCLVSCGVATEFHDLRIVDAESCNELNELEVGEIWFAGPSVSDGYWNKPDESSLSFGFRLPGLDQYSYLRTGDLGFKFRGELYITGRIKDLIIVKGKNYYPNDLEKDSAEVVLGLSSSAAFEVDGKVVMIHEVGRKVRKNFDGINARQAIRAEILNQHEILIDVIEFVAAGQLPITSSGKIQRRLAKQLYLKNEFSYLASKELEPEAQFNKSVIDVTLNSDTEEKIESIWKELFDLQHVSVNDNLFDLGGHSLIATKLVSEIERVFTRKISLVDVLQNPTISSLAALVEKTGRTHVEPLDFTVDRKNRFDAFPLTNVQQAYWLGRKSEFELGNVGCHGYYEIPSKNFNYERFSEIWNQLIQRHEMLRVVIDPNGLQRILNSPCDYLITHYQMQGASEQEVLSHFDLVRDGMSHQVFSGETWPLFDIRVSRLSDSESVIHYSMDALVLDASSALILEQEMRKLYAAPEKSLPAIEGSFRDYVLACQSLKGTKRFQRAKEYWLARLDGFPSRPELPLALDPSTIDEPRFERRQIVLDDVYWQTLKLNANANRVTPTVFIIACLSKVIDLWSQNSKFVLNLTLFNRAQSDLNINSIVGDFTTTTLLEVDNLLFTEGFGEGMRHIQHQLWNDLEHKDFDGIEVQNILKQDHQYDLGFPIVVTSSLGLEVPTGKIEQNSIMSGVDANFAITQTPQVWLDIQLYECVDGLCINWDSVEGLFPEGVLDAMSDAMSSLLRSLSSEENSCLLKAPNIFPQHQSDLITSVNSTDVAVAAEVLHSALMRCIETYPDNVAIVSESRTLTYRDLGVLSNQLAHQLASSKRVGRPVAVVMQKGWEQIVAVLGILRSGNAYVPIDAQLPLKRIAALLDICGAHDVISTPSCEGVVSRAYRCTLVQYSVFDQSLEPIIDVASPESTAYIIFTSGTTGVPKGVAIRHLSALNTVLDINRRFNVTAKDSVLGLSSLSFDLSVYDVFGVLGAGGRLILPAPEETKDPEAWRYYLSEYGVTLWNTAPALMSLFANVMRQDEGVPGLRLVMLSGDWIPVDLPDRIADFSPQAKIISLGGATEASIWSIAHEIVEESSDWVSIPYGKALANQKIMVLRDDLSYCPFWVMGDIYISGIGLALGYWKDQEKTAASFIIHPDTKQRLYKTGDKGRLRPCGNIEFLGRVDSQVKIQGHRIELGEIETALRKSNLLRDVLVIARDQPKRLVAYIVADNVDDQAGLIETLLAYLKSHLPGFMIPSVIMPLQSIPLTSNGKVDRSKLPEPDASQSLKHFIAPKNSIEVLLSGLWGELLEVDRVGVNDNFFILGGNSQLAIQLKARLQQEGLLVSISDLFGAPTLEALASLVSEIERDASDSQFSYVIPAQCESIDLEMLPLLDGLNFNQDTLDEIISKIPGGAKNIQDIYPLAANQLGLFLHHTLSTSDDIYVLPNLFSVESASHFESFISNLNIIIERHDVLRTAIIWRDLALPVQVVCRTVELPIEWLTFADKQGVEDAMIQRCKPSGLWLDLEQAPLVRIEVARDNHSDQHFVLIKIHHSILDHVGLDLIFSELAQLQNGNQSDLNPAPRYRDFVAYSLKYAETSTAERFFTQRLSDIVDPSLPFGLQNIRDNGLNIEHLVVPLKNGLSAQIRSVMRLLKLTPASLFHAAWSLVLSASTNQKNIVFGTVLSGRSDAFKGSENGVGLFLNTLPLRVQIADQDILSFVSEVQTNLIDLLAVEQTSLVLAQRCSGVENGVPLFSSLLNFRHIGNSEMPYAGITPIVNHERTNYPLTISVDDVGDGFNLDVQVDASVGAKRLVTYMQTVLHEMVTELQREVSKNDHTHDPRLVSDINFLPSSEHSYLTETLNATTVDYRSDQCVHQLFEAQATMHPERIALVYEAQQLSYGELNQRSNQLAHYLVDQGVNPDTLVALCVERSLEMVIGILGILKAGGAYVPLDPNYPEARLNYMLADSAVDLVLTQSHLVGLIPSADHRLLLLDDDDLQAVLSEHSNSNIDKVEQGLTSEHLAYVIYTSGSTGQPKGVLCTHKALHNRIDWMAREYAVGRDDRVLQKTPYTFDVSVWEFVLPLSQGSCLVMAKPEGH